MTIGHIMTLAGEETLCGENQARVWRERKEPSVLLGSAKKANCPKCVDLAKQIPESETYEGLNGDGRLGLVDIAVIRGYEEDEQDMEFLVVTNRKYGGFTTAGGKIDPGEHHDDAAVRELQEETGLVVDPENLYYVGCFKHTWRGIPVYCHGYYVYYDDLNGQEPKQVEEGTEPFWVKRDRLLDPGDACIAQSYYGWLMGKKGWDG